MPNQTTNQQLLALRDAVLTFSANLTLPETLQRIVTAAAKLVNARYAALGVPDETGERLAEFVTHGLSLEAIARIGPRPRGHGLLGVMLHEGQSLRLPDLSQHPRSSGFPAHHPPMKSFLGVPIIHQGRLHGDFYLCDKIGAEEFSEADQALIELLASHAALAIERARAHQAQVDREHALEFRNRELMALNAVISATSASLSLQHVLDEALRHMMAVYHAEGADIYLVDEPSGDLILALYRGPTPEPFFTYRRVPHGKGILGEVATTGQMRVLRDLPSNPALLRQHVAEAGFTSMACLPLPTKNRIVGTLDLFSRNPGHFDEFNPALALSISNQIGIAVENARLHEQVGQMAVAQERQRIGMDLHDGVIQSIYAAGLTLELVLAELAEGNTTLAHKQVHQAIETLNTTIHDIRSYLLALRPRRFEGSDLVAGMERLLSEYRANTQMEVTLSAEPDIDRMLSMEERMALFHIAQEALSNTARHSRASQVSVRLAAENEWVVLELRDNGCGLPPEAARRADGHGLRNMRDRARALGGDVQMRDRNGQGTEVRVVLPRRLT